MTQNIHTVDKKLCGVFGREDAITNVHTQMINWHGPTGTVFSVDIQPFKSGRKRRVATGGSDSNVQIWELKKDAEGAGCVEHISQLNRHDCAVNVVRFHPTDDVLASASDDRCLFIWRLDTTNTDGMPNIFSDQETEQIVNSENWTVVKQMRGHGSEVYDLAWSPDATCILSGTMDNTAYVWNTESCRKLATLQQHKGYVQGVAWDPCNKVVTTVSSDRSAIVYNTSKFEPVQRISKVKSAQRFSKRTPTPSNPDNSEVRNAFEVSPNVADVHNNSTEESVTSSKTSKDMRMKMFLDTGMVDTFFRRPGFSPDGKLVAYPCGCYEVENTDRMSADSEEDNMLQINVVYIFQLNNLDSPAMCLPTGHSPAVAVRFCAQLFALRPKLSTHTQLFNLCYRMIYAVITLDNVLIYDTQQEAPLACISSIHYEQLTDASWSSDGSYLIVSSIDGFCTIITLDTEKLGQVYRTTESVHSVSSCSVQNNTQSISTTVNNQSS